MKKIGIIIGTTRENRVSKSVADWVFKVAKQVANNNVEYSLIDLKDINLPLIDEPLPAAMAKGNYQHEHTKKWSKLIAGYDAFVIVTGEYNAGYPAVLKNALDYLYAEWNNKPMALVGYGYPANGARSIEQLRQVLNNLKVNTLHDSVLMSLGETLKETGFQTTEKLEQLLTQLLQNLAKELA